MSTVLRRNRKGSDRDITRLNALGLSLSTIAERLNCHPTSITLRLKGLEIKPADTRRSFMESIYSRLYTGGEEIISDMLEDRNMSIKDYVFELISNDLENRTHNQAQPSA